MCSRCVPLHKHPAVLVAIVAIALGTEPAGTQSVDTPTRIALAASIEGEVTPEMRRRFVFEAAEGDYIRIELRHRGDAIAAKLYGPDTKELAEASSGPRFRGGDAISVVLTTSGEYRVELGPLGKATDKRGFELRFAEHRPATEVDKVRVAAERAYFQAELLRNETRADALKKAVALYRESAELAARAGDELLESDALHHLALTLDYLGDYPASIAEYERALALRRKLGDRLREGETTSNMGAVYRFSGQVRNAIPLYEAALVIRREIGDEVGESSTLHNLGTVAWNLGDYDGAIEQYQRALTIRERLRLPIEAAETMIGIGTAYRAKGDVQTALQFYVDALEGKRKHGDRRGEYNALQNIGVAYSSIGEYERALSYLTEALTLSRTAGDKRWESAALVSSANVHRAQGAYDKALPLYEQALALRREMGDRRGQGEVLSNMGLVVEADGNVRLAVERYEEALTFNRSDGDRRGEASTIVNAASALLKLGDHAIAEKRFLEAREIQRQIKDRSGEINAISGLARVALARGDLDASLRFVEEATTLTDTLGSGLALPNLRASFFGTQEDISALHIDVLMRLHRRAPEGGYAARAFVVSEKMKARTLREVLATAGASVVSAADPALVDRERRLRARVNAAERARLQLLEGRPSSVALRAAEQELETAISQHQQAEAQLRQSAGAMSAATAPALEEIQRLLPADTTLIEYALGQEQSVAWVVTRDAIHSVDLPSRGVIDAAARRLYERVSESARLEARAAARSAASELSRLILAPLAKHLSRERLLVVPDGALQYVPFAALPRPASRAGSADETPMVVAHELVMLPSASVVPAMREWIGSRRAPTKTLAVIADPVLEREDPRLSRRGTSADPRPAARTVASRAEDLKRSAADSGVPSLERLVFSGTEADEIARLVAGGTKLVGLEAQRDRIIGDALSDYRIVHFATHGLINSQRPELSGVVLSLIDTAGQPVDGFLRLNDIAHLRLNADLVVLSACRTALGRAIRGEGLLGLTRGFMAAGAPRVVASLWDVRDRATAELMKRFYTAMLKDNLRPAAALRRAQISMLKDPRWSSPFHWAGFVLQGEWN